MKPNLKHVTEVTPYIMVRKKQTALCELAP